MLVGKLGWLLPVFLEESGWAVGLFGLLCVGAGVVVVRVALDLVDDPVVSSGAVWLSVAVAGWLDVGEVEEGAALLLLGAVVAGMPGGGAELSPAVWR